MATNESLIAAGIVGGIVGMVAGLVDRLWKGARTTQQNAALQANFSEFKGIVEADFKEVKKSISEIHDEQLKASAVKEDVEQLQKGHANVLTIIGNQQVIQSQVNDLREEVQRIRDRRHDGFEEIRSALAKRDDKLDELIDLLKIQHRPHQA
jgi:DNA repair exonuclease SbcCD ATPase subunit